MVDTRIGPAGHSATRLVETERDTEHDNAPIPRQLTVDMIARGLGTTGKCLTVTTDRVKVRNIFSFLKSWILNLLFTNFIRFQDQFYFWRMA